MILPKGYVRLEYIQSSGTQYINTAVTVASDLDVEADFQYTTKPSSGSSLVFGGDQLNGNIGFGFNWYNASEFYVYYNGTFLWADNDSTWSARYVFRQNGKQCYFNGTLLGSVNNNTTFTGTRPLLLFGGHGGNGKFEMPAVGKMFSAKIKKAGTLVRYFVPAKRSSDGALGLYDTVNSKFYTNAGSGTFTAGPVLADVVGESEMTELEYIQITGTQHINTLFKPNQNTRLKLSAYNESTSTGCIYGCRNGSSSGMFGALATSGFAYGSNYASINMTAVGAMEIDQNKNSGTYNGTTVSVSAQTFTGTYDLFVGTCNASGSITSGRFYGKIYACQIYNNGLLVRDYIPAKTIEGEIGLYDRVFHEFYRNAGTGAFIAGPEKVKAPKAPGNFRVVSESDTEVVLAWDASENAAGYRLYRNGGLLADTTELTYTDPAEPFGAYTYTVRAYNELGESDAAELVVIVSPDNPILWLVTDRTAQDVAEQNSKGVYTAVDLNRVGAAVDLLKNLLESAGFIVNVFPKLMWKDTEWMNASQAEQYLADIQTLRTKQAVLPTTPETPETMARLNYTGANHIEQILLDVYTQYLIMLTTRVAAGTATSGGDYL